jgi:hypothetical protein
LQKRKGRKTIHKIMKILKIVSRPCFLSIIVVLGICFNSVDGISSLTHESKSFRNAVKEKQKNADVKSVHAYSDNHERRHELHTRITDLGHIHSRVLQEQPNMERKDGLQLDESSSSESNTAPISSDSQVIRTATGGIIYTLLRILTIFAVLGNFAFLIYVFWLSK